MIDVAPACKDNPWAVRLPVLENFLVAALISIGKWIFLLERLATEELVEPGMILHSPAAADQNLLENLVVLAGDLLAATALVHRHPKGGHSICDSRILQVQEAGIRAGSLFLFGNRDLDIDWGIVVGILHRFHINDVSVFSILVDNVTVGLGGPRTLVLRNGIESPPTSTASVAVLNEDGRLKGGGEVVRAESILERNSSTTAILQIGRNVVDGDLTNNGQRRTTTPTI